MSFTVWRWLCLLSLIHKGALCLDMSYFIISPHKQLRKVPKYLATSYAKSIHSHSTFKLFSFIVALSQWADHEY